MLSSPSEPARDWPGILHRHERVSDPMMNDAHAAGA